MSRSDPQFKLRLPIELKERVEEEAKRNKRSINAEILAKLESHSNNERFSLEYLLKRDIKHNGATPDAKIKIIRLENELRTVQGLALNYLDVDFSLPLDDLRSLLEYGMRTLIKTNSKFQKLEKVNWFIYKGRHHLRFAEKNNLDDLNILFVGDDPVTQ